MPKKRDKLQTLVGEDDSSLINRTLLPPTEKVKKLIHSQCILKTQMFNFSGRGL